MRLKPEQLAAALKKGLAPIYFFTGDEPLQLGELADAVRQAARKAGYGNREILSVEKDFDWQQLAFAADSMSIFADQKIIDLRLPSGTPGADGAKALMAYCARLPEDTLLLITAGKLASGALKSQWLQSLEKHGVVVQVWPLAGQDLLNWLQQRLLQRGLQTDSSGLKLLAMRLEGNLLAAAQEIEKLYVLYGAGTLSHQQLYDVVADSSRYDVYKLIDSALTASVNRIVKILAGLRAEGVAEAIVVWAITREVRTLIKIKLAIAQGQARELVFKNHQIWDIRKPLVSAAIARLSIGDLNSVLVLSATADRQFKGQQAGDAWDTLLAACLRLASVTVV